MTDPRVTIFAPATVSNVGPGFDVLGFALPRPGDRVEAELTSQAGIDIVDITGDGGLLPRAADRNVVGVAAAAVLRRAGRDAGIRLWLHKGLPLFSGLGSSGASAAAAAVAVNSLLDRPLSDTDVVRCAMEGEQAACGSAHADNVAPSILGGIVVIRSYHPLDLVQLPVPDGLFVAVVHPRRKVATSEARALLAGRTFGLPEIVANMGNLAALIAAVHQGDLDLLGRCIEDRLVEPVRAALVAGYPETKRAALEAGALGCSISGSGPSVFAFAASTGEAVIVAQAMRRAFRSAAGLDSDAWTGPISREGARAVA